MNDHQKTKQQLIEELAELRQRVAVLESAENERQRSEERYRLLTESIPQMLWRADANRQTIECNRRWYEYTGQTPEEARGLGWMKALHPDDVAGVAERVQEALAAGEPYQAEYRVRRASDGSYRWHLSRALPMKDDDGRITGWFGSVTDIDEQKRADDERDRGRAILAATVECLPFEFFAIGTDGRYMLQNATLREHYGDAIGKRPDEYATDELTRQLWLDNNRRAFAGERVEGEVEAHVRGQTRHLFNIISPIRVEGTVYGILGVNVDITERKRAEEALRQSEQRLSLHFQQTPLGAIEWDLEFKVTRWNPGAVRIFGYSPEEALDRHASFIVPPNVREHVDQVWNDLLLRKGGERSTNENVTKNGRAILCEWYNTPLVDANGNVIGVASLVDDITEKKQAEEALAKAHDELEEKVKQRTFELANANEQLAIFQRFAEAAGQGFGMADLDGHITYVNPALCRMFGEQQPEDAVGKHVSTYYSAEYIQQRGKETLPALYRVGHWQGERTILSRQGTLVPTLHDNFLIRDAAGQPIRLAAVITDFSERKKAEEALRQSHEELQAIYDGMGDGLLITDIETLQFVRANASICRMLGYSETELRSLSVKAVHPAEAVSHILERIRSVEEATQTPIGNIPFLRKDGSVFYAEVIGTFVTYDGRPCSMGIFRDVTERMQAAAALAESEAKYRQLVETTDTGYLILNAEGRVVDANGEYLRISGHHNLAQIVGHSVVEWTAPYDRDRNAREVEQCVQAGRVRQLEIDYIRPDGTAIPVEINASVIGTNEGNRIVSLCRDITERHKAQEALERERQSLWRMLQASDHERQTISYDIHDGLAQYLAAAGMQFQVFERLRESNPEAAKKAYDAATQLVSQSHSEARRLISEVRPPVIDEIGLETAISHLVHEQRQRGGPKIKFDSDVQFGRLPPILENALYRIAQEVLTNACKHSESKKVTVTMTQEGQDVRLEVRDWGIGFDPESVEQGHFGLEGIRQRVRLLGGRLTIESTPDSGTLIQVVVPILEKQNDE